ncbi:MAG: DUF3796 domain-containing protein [Oscillospiraceae bacterium]|nr:DUF3796 domain-containing protein [Oscillospiraceae bacterium]
MKKFNEKLTVILAIVVVLLLGASSWYAVTFNEGRLVKPTDFSVYAFRPQDLPMLISLTLFILYVLYLGILLCRAIIANKLTQKTSKTTRKINPKLGLLGFLGFCGFLGFWTYSAYRAVSPFVFFGFFGFFGFFYEGKMSNTFMDERYEENRVRAELMAHRAAISVIFLALILLNLNSGAILGSLEYTLIALTILISLAVALDVFLSEYLLYRYDCADQPDAGGED